MAKENTGKETFMNAIATIAYSIIFVILVCSVAIFVQYCITGFKKPEVPVEGLKFSNETIQVTTDNLDNAYFTLTATNELSEEIKNSNGDYAKTTVKLIVKNPEVLELEKTEVELNEAVKIIPKYAEDGYLVGGTCVIEASSADGRFMAKNMTIDIDVPIESIVIKAKNKINQDVTEKINNDEIKFIKNDILNFSIETVPARAIKPIKNVDAKIAVYPNDDIRTDMVTLTTDGVLTVVGDDNSTTGDITVIAKVLKSYGIDESVEENWITESMIIKTSRAELNEIQIRNTNYDDESEDISIYIGEKESLKFSARETNNPDIINLNLFLEPVFYTEGDDPFLPLMSGLHLEAIIEGQREGIVAPLSISTEVVDEDGNKNIIWTLTANRSLETVLDGVSESISLLLSLENYDQTRQIGCSIEASYPQSGTIAAVNDDIQLSITKLTNANNNEYIGDSSKGVQLIDENFLTYSQDSDRELTYSKFVYFLEGDPTTWVNLTGSKIVNCTDYGQLIYEDEDENVTYNTAIQALGSGTVQIMAYLVKTNSAGVPIDCNYNEILDSNTNIVSVSEINGNYDGYAGCYVCVDQTEMPFSVVVEEKLTELKLYTETATDSGEKQEVLSTLKIGNSNPKTLFVKANSTYALLDNWAAFNITSELADLNRVGISCGSTEEDAIIKTYDVANTELVKSAEYYFTVTGYAGEQDVGSLSVSLNSTKYIDISIQTVEVAIAGVEILNTELFSIDGVTGEKYINLKEQLNQDGAIVMSQWTNDSNNEFSTLPNAGFSIKDVDKAAGYTQPSSQTYSISPYVIGVEDLQKIRNGTAYWEGSDEGGENADKEQIPVDKEYVKIVSDAGIYNLYILNGDLPVNCKLVIAYYSINERYNDLNPNNYQVVKADYFIINLTPATVEIFGNGSPDTISMPSAACPTDNDAGYGGGLSSDINSGILNFTVIYQDYSMEESVKQEYLTEKLIMKLDDTSAKYFEIDGRSFYLKDNITAYTKNTNLDLGTNYHLIEEITVTFSVDYYACKIGEEYIPKTKTKTITVTWGDGYKVSPLIK